MYKRNLSIQFFIILVLLLALAFGVHLLVLYGRGLPLFDNLIVRSYIVNCIMATVIFVGLYRFREKLKNQIGFLFMGGSLLKFLIFFLLFYPTYKSDGDMSGLEFAAFFIPYLAALFLETFFTSKMLKNLEGSTEK